MFAGSGFLSITPKSVDSNATIQLQVNGGAFSTIASGAPNNLPLYEFSPNTVLLKVTAADGVTTQTYTLIVTKPIVRPVVVSSAASAITKNSATLNGQVTAKSDGDVNISFGYGLGGVVNYSSTIVATPATATGGTATAVSANITGLMPATVYSFTLNAAIGSVVGSGDQLSFQTLPNDDATLSSLTTTIGAVSPPLASNATSLAVATTANVKSISIASSLTDPNAFTYIQVDDGNSIGVAPDTNTSVALNAGGTTIVTIQVMAQDLVTKKNYTLTITSPPWLPTVSTYYASSITSNSATLGGAVDAHSIGTTVSFEYGATSAYGQTIEAIPNAITNVTGVSAAAPISGLLPNTLYHFRINGSTGAGTSHGADQTFTTLKSSDASLASLSMSHGLLSPVFSSNTTAYTLAVAPSVTSLTLTPVGGDPNTTMQVQIDGGSLTNVASGSPSPSLVLNSTGNSVINLNTVAQDGFSTRTYTFNLVRRAVYKTWQMGHFGAASTGVGYSEDFDGDGINNLTEFAFGTDPAAADKGKRTLSYSGNVITPGGITTESIGGAPMAEFVRRRDYVDAGLTYTVQFSSKLATWETDSRTPIVLATDGTCDVVGLTYPKLSTGLQAKFFRVTVSIAP